MGKMYTVQRNSDGKIYVAVGPHWPGAVVTYSVLFGTSLMVSLIGSIENKLIWSIFCIATTMISLCAQIFLLLTVRKKHEEDMMDTDCLKTQEVIFVIDAKYISLQVVVIVIYATYAYST